MAIDCNHNPNFFGVIGTRNGCLACELESVKAEAQAILNWPPVIYHLDDNEIVVAFRTEENKLLLNFAAPILHRYIDKPDWFTKEYVAAYNGIVPEFATQGEEPGQWESIPGYLRRIRD